MQQIYEQEALFRPRGRPRTTGALTNQGAKVISGHLAWMKQRGYADGYIGYRATILRALDAAGGTALTWQQIEQVVLGRPMADSTKNLWLVHLKGFYAWAMKYADLPTNPVVNIDKLHVAENLPRPIGEHDLQIGLANADDTMRLWLLLGAWAGLRCMEIAHLHAEHLGRDIRAIRVVDSKHGGSRVVPMHHRIVAALPEQTVGRLWRISPNLVSQRVSRHFRAHGVAATAHQLRHRFATQVYESTGDINIVRELLGHKSTATTQIYARLSDPRRRAAVDGLA